ncbi:MAG TPA: hypothetical protein VFG10_12805 [Saprospiraceae bacterium]|nr:hypothetical protein [Saprospiraceae bacterium]
MIQSIFALALQWMEEKLDKTAFKKQTAEDAANTVAYWRTQSYADRLTSAYHLSLRAYGYDPADEPRLDRTAFSTRKHPE